MNNSINEFFAFAAGAVIGSIVTWKALETKLRNKYEKIAQEEIDSVKETFARRRAEIDNIIEEASDIFGDVSIDQSTDDIKTCEEISQIFPGYKFEVGKSTQPFGKEYTARFKDILDARTDDIKTCEEVSRAFGYAIYSDVTNKKEVNDVKRPYVITPEEFGETDYETISLTYYVDGVLTDDNDEPIDDVDDVVGLDSLKHFGEYEDDSVFVRNDKYKCDYEILMDVREYSKYWTNR